MRRDEPRRPLVHLGSFSHEQWSISSEVRAVTDAAISAEEAAGRGLFNRRIVCWHPSFWRAVPDHRKADNRILCFFHHYVFNQFDDTQIVGGICMNPWMRAILKTAQPSKPVWVADVGGAEAAVPYASRRHPVEQIRLLMVGNASAPLCDEVHRQVHKDRSRKGVELILPIARRLDRHRYAWVFVGKNWEPYAEALSEQGWTVICPGLQQPPWHFVTYGEGDIYLMLSQIEGGPLPLLETMGLGLWPISTPTGFAGQILRHGANGHLLPVFNGQNIDEVADAVVKHVCSLDRQALARARPLVQGSVAHRTWANFKRQIDAIVEDVLK